MSIRRQSQSSVKSASLVAPAQPCTPAPPSIHPAAEDAWNKMIQHPSSALLTHVPRPVVGAPMQPGTAQEGAFSNTDNLRMLIPFILVAFNESAREEKKFMTLCSKITNLLATNKQLDNLDAWYLVLKELRMPLISYPGNDLWPPIMPTDVNYPRKLFELYCRQISKWDVSNNGVYDQFFRSLQVYPASIILKEWQRRIVAYSIPTHEPFEEFKEAVRAWIWVVNNYEKFFKATNTFFQELLIHMVRISSDRAWEFFVKRIYNDTMPNINLSSFNDMFVGVLLRERDLLMDAKRLELSNRTFDYVMSMMPPGKTGSFMVALAENMANSHGNQAGNKRQTFDEDDVPLFYSRLIMPIMTKFKTLSLPSQYVQILNSIGNAFANSIDYHMQEAISKGWFVPLNAIVFEMRIFLMSSFPSESNFVDNFEKFMTNEKHKKIIRELLQPETTRVEWYPLPWPTSIYKTLP